MQIKTMLTQTPFEKSEVITGSHLLHKNVLSAMVLEAVDIENWGEPEQLILTSYFALERLTLEEMEIFFEKMKNIGISGIVLKMDRLVSEVPKILIELCDMNQLPLIAVPKTVMYETIIFAVLKPVINHNANLLELYYQTRQELNKLAPKLPSIEEMLHKFKVLLGHDFQFTIPQKNQIISTDTELTGYKIINSIHLKNEKFMSFNYVRHQVQYSNQANSPNSVVCVEIPNLENQNYILTIFENSKELNELDYMVIDNAVEFLQAELLKNYTIKHSQFLKRNDLMIDLLNTRYYSPVEQEELLTLVDLNHFELYQGVMVSLYDNQNIPSTQISLVLQSFINILRGTYSPIAFYSKNNKVIFLHNIKNERESFSKNELQSLMDQVLSTHNTKKSSSVFCHMAISGIHNKHDLKEINKECLDTTKMMHHFYQESHILEYDNIGIFKYFLETDSLSDLEKFIPKDLAKLRMENPELFKTFKVFLTENQNYVTTANKLFIHPKTVRYRIDKIKHMLDIDLGDSEQILLYQIAIRLYEFM